MRLGDMIFGVFRTAPIPVTLDGTPLVAGVDRLGNLNGGEQYAPLAEDAPNGVIATALKPLSAQTYALTKYTSSAAEQKSEAVKTGSGMLYYIAAANKNAGTQYVWVFDALTAAGVPIVTPFPVGTNATVQYPLPLYGIPFTTGLSIALSSTFLTYTGASTDAIFTLGYK